MAGTDVRKESSPSAASCCNRRSSSSARSFDWIRVVNVGDKVDQRGVNRIRHRARSLQNRFRSMMRPCELTREHTNPAASTFNPKVAGSIPARPIEQAYLQLLCAHVVVGVENGRNAARKFRFSSSHLGSARCGSLSLPV